MRLLGLLVASACGGGAAVPPQPVVAKRELEVPMSDPAEYGIDRITREAGRLIFERTGLGDPYRTGIPFPVFLALLDAYPQVFGKTFGELAAKFGFVPHVKELGDDLDRHAEVPVGMHLTVDPITGVPFLVTNCALCHADRIAWQGGEALVVGLGNKRVRIHDYDAAFAKVTALPGFSVERLGKLADRAAERLAIAWPEQFRGPLVAATVSELQKRAKARAELHARVAGGPPGRVAVIESFAFALGQLTGKHVGHAADVGWAKVPDVIGFGQRTTLSWDASQEGPIDLLVVEADLANGMRVEWLERHPFQGPSLGAYLRQPARRPPFPGAIDRARAERGRALFDKHCSDCHGTYAADGRVLDYDESIVPIEDLGTDHARLRAPTEGFERAANDPDLTRGYTRFRRSSGYVPPVLTNVWARAPYGHAGQWPSLAVLATPPDKRPVKFVLELDRLYDLDAVGVRWAPSGVGEFVHDASRPGFSVAGHAFLSELGPDAGHVIEYLKTL